MRTAAIVFLSVVVAAGQAPEGGLRLVGAAVAHEGVLRLTSAVRMQRGAAWRTTRVLVRDGFETTFRFRISERGGLGNGADGLAFVIQNHGPEALAGHGGSGGFAEGDGRSGNNHFGAIPTSLAVFFDTHRNPEDQSGNSISICTNGNGEKGRWPPARIAANWKPRVDLKDGRIHEVRIEFVPPLMSVSVDGTLELRAPVDLGRMVAGDGAAYLGFTASTGNGFENHDVIDWRVRARAASEAFMTSSSLVFAPMECRPSKGLCTPPRAVVEAMGAGEFHVILPADQAWGAEIPNPEGLRVRIRNVRDIACWAGEAGPCGEVMVRTEKGRTAFSIRDQNYRDNQGYAEFEVSLEKGEKW